MHVVQVLGVLGIFVATVGALLAASDNPQRRRGAGWLLATGIALFGWAVIVAASALVWRGVS